MNFLVDQVQKFSAPSTTAGSTVAPLNPQLNRTGDLLFVTHCRCLLRLSCRYSRISQRVVDYAIESHFILTKALSKHSSLVSPTAFTRPVRQLTKVNLLSSSTSFSHQTLVDSGADANLIDYQLAERLNLPSLSLSQPLNATALDGRLFCTVTHHTALMTLTFTYCHSEDINFNL